jgi:hypothetical protein
LGNGVCGVGPPSAAPRLLAFALVLRVPGFSPLLAFLPGVPGTLPPSWVRLTGHRLQDWYCWAVPERTRGKQAAPRQSSRPAAVDAPLSGEEQAEFPDSGFSERARGGRFASGSSGNPAGRPKGARNRATLMAQELLDGEGEAIMRKAIQMAKAGEPIAMRLCIERILPRRANVVELILPFIQQADDVAEACGSVIDAAAKGTISLQEAKEFMGLLEFQRRAIESHDLAVRIELLERGPDPVEVP